MVSLSMTLSDPWSGFQGYGSLKGEYLQSDAFYKQLLYRTLIGNHRQAIDRQASYTAYNSTPLLLRKPCKLFASVARVCQRQLAFVVYEHYVDWNFMSVRHCRYMSPYVSLIQHFWTCSRSQVINTDADKYFRQPSFFSNCRKFSRMTESKESCQSCMQCISEHCCIRPEKHLDLAYCGYITFPSSYTAAIRPRLRVK